MISSPPPQGSRQETGVGRNPATEVIGSLLRLKPWGAAAQERLQGAHPGRKEPRGQGTCSRSGRSSVSQGRAPRARAAAAAPERRALATGRTGARAQGRGLVPPQHVRGRRGARARAQGRGGSAPAHIGSGLPRRRLSGVRRDGKGAAGEGTAAQHGAPGETRPCDFACGSPAPEPPELALCTSQHGRPERSTYPSILPLPLGSFARGTTRAFSPLPCRWREGSSLLLCPGPILASLPWPRGKGSPRSGRCLWPSLLLDLPAAAAALRSTWRAAGRGCAGEGCPGAGGRLCAVSVAR